jgi:KaiC/GvpD/RAD55 family RecA-like ATPase
MRGPDASELRKRLSDPQQLCTSLGLLEGYKPGRQAGGGLLIRCPAHGERHPSCSIRRGKDGTIQVRCFSCGFKGDALSLVATARGLDRNRQFAQVLAEAAYLAGYPLAAPPDGSGTRQVVPPAPSRAAPMANVAAPGSHVRGRLQGDGPRGARGDGPRDGSLHGDGANGPRGSGPRGDGSGNHGREIPVEGPDYPDELEVAGLWAACGTVEGDEPARAYLTSRAIDCAKVAALDLARVLPAGAEGPSWARYRGKPWGAAGFRLLIPMFDAQGVLRSLRAWHFDPQEDVPKRVAPAGKSVAGLVMACPRARELLRTGRTPTSAPIDVVVAEGEPDFLTHATRTDEASAPAVLGVVASGWSSAVADRLADNVRVVIRTHRDAAGDRYAADVRSSLAGRVPVFDFPRPSDSSAKLPDDNDDAQNGELGSYLDNIEPGAVADTGFQPLSHPSDSWSAVSTLVGRLRNAPAKLSTGVPNIDEGWRGGAPAGLVWVIGGAPGAGKTTWVTNLAHQWARDGIPVGYIAGDEAREGILIRLGQQAGIDRKCLEEGAPVALDDLEKHLDGLPLLLVDPDEDVGIDVANVATALRRHWTVEGPAVLIIDSLQAMARRIPDDVADTPRAKVDAFMKSCKAVAKRLQLVVICLSELARGAYRGGNDQTNDLAAAKESGAIEYEAGALCVLRPVEEEPGLVAVSWAKSRPGRVEPFALRVNHRIATVTASELPTKKSDLSAEARHRELLVLVEDMVKRNPGINGSRAIATRLERRRTDVINALDELVSTGVVENRGDIRHPRLFSTSNSGS